MRQFLLGANKPYASVNKFMDVPAGAIGIFVLNENDELTLVTDGSQVKGMANIVLGRSAKDGGPVVIPFNKRGFRYNFGEYKPANKFKVTIDIPDATNIGTYSIIVVQKGKLFNERNKWTSDIYVDDIDMTGEQIAEALARVINGYDAEDAVDGSCVKETAKMLTSGVKATVDGKTITIEALESGKAFNVVCADELMGVKVNKTKEESATDYNTGIPAYGDAAYVVDLACKSAADAGFEYTFEEDIKMYLGYPLNPLASADKEDTGFDIFNLVFYEGREVKNVDQVVRQLVQIVVPTGSDCVGTLKTIFDKIAE